MLSGAGIVPQTRRGIVEFRRRPVGAIAVTAGRQNRAVRKQHHLEPVAGYIEGARWGPHARRRIVQLCGGQICPRGATAGC